MIGGEEGGGRDPHYAYLGPRCSADTKGGRRCEYPAVAGDLLCIYHLRANEPAIGGLGPPSFDAALESGRQVERAITQVDLRTQMADDEGRTDRLAPALLALRRGLQNARSRKKIRSAGWPAAALDALRVIEVSARGSEVMRASAVIRKALSRRMGARLRKARLSTSVLEALSLLASASPPPRRRRRGWEFLKLVYGYGWRETAWEELESRVCQESPPPPPARRRPRQPAQRRSAAVRAKISQATKAALALRRAGGQRTSRWAPYGWRLVDGQLMPDDTERTIIIEARSLRSEGLSYRSIARRLAEAGHNSRAGRPFKASTIMRLLQTDNRDPLGTDRLKKEPAR